MFKKIILVVLIAAFTMSASYAANINVASGSSIQAAINSADEGDTITLTSTAVYKENLRINKSIKLVAAVGQNPKVEQLDNTTTAPVILGLAGAPTTVQLGSLTGGRLTFQYLKWGFGTAATMPTAMIKIDVTTDSTVVIENCDLTSIGDETFGPVTGIQHGQNPATVSVRYSDLNLNRAAYAAGGVSANRVGCTGIDISNNSPTGGATITRRVPGPTYNLDHVRIKGYVRAGLWLHYTSMTLNASYIDVGTAGENTVIGTANIPWGPLVSFNLASTWTGRIQNSIFGGPLSYGAFGKIGPRGTSITLNRTVLIGTGGTNLAYGTLDLGSNAAGTGNPVRFTADHCDFVHLGIAPASAMARTSANAEMILTVTNSNIYSQNAAAVNFPAANIATSVINFSNNNVYGAAANVGYVAGTGDISFDPMYPDAANADLRYTNNTLKTADSNGGPVGVNADYSDVVTGIIAGNPGVVNAARNWTLMR